MILKITGLSSPTGNFKAVIFTVWSDFSCLSSWILTKYCKPSILRWEIPTVETWIWWNLKMTGHFRKIHNFESSNSKFSKIYKILFLNQAFQNLKVFPSSQNVWKYENNYRLLFRNTINTCIIFNFWTFPSELTLKFMLVTRGRQFLVDCRAKISK